MLDKTGHLSKYKSFLICRFANVTSALSGLILFSVATFTLSDITMLLCVLGSACLTLCDPMNCSSPGSPVAWISQGKILEWVAISSSRGSSWPRDRTRVSCVSCFGRRILHHWATWEAWLILLHTYYLISLFLICYLMSIFQLISWSLDPLWWPWEGLIHLKKNCLFAYGYAWSLLPYTGFP